MFDSSDVSVPTIRMVDAAAGALGIEWIDGESVRHLLPGGSINEADGHDLGGALNEYQISIGDASSRFLVISY